MRIAIDLDGVVIDLVDEMLPKLSQLAGRFISPMDIIEFDIGAALGLNGRQMDELWRWLKASGAYRRAHPVDGAVDAIMQLSQLETTEIFFVSSRPEDLRPESSEWLESHGLGEFPLILRPRGPKVLASDQANILIEDDPRDLHVLSQVVEKLILLERPWNREARLPSNCLRVRSWRDVLDAICI